MNYQGRSNKLEHSFSVIISWLRSRFCEKQLTSLSKLYVGKGTEELFVIFLRKSARYALTGMVVAGVLCALFVISSSKKHEIWHGNMMERSEAGGRDKTIEMQIETEDGKQDYTVKLPARKLTKHEIKEQFAIAREKVQKLYLGENNSADNITSSLNLIETVPDTMVQVAWQLDKEGLITDNGEIVWAEIIKPYKTEITAELSCEDVQESVVLELTIQPPQRTKFEQWLQKWEAAFNKRLEDTASDKRILLPTRVEGREITYRDKTDSYLVPCVVGMILTAIAGMLLYNSQMQQNVRKRDEELCKDYPEMVEQFVLLVGAGMTIKSAWIKMTDDYQSGLDRKQAKRYLYEEMSVTEREMQNGMGEERAYELFAKRTGILCYMKFSALLTQNLRKGSADMLRLLEQEAQDAFQKRKEQAKEAGEKAGTKMLFPMMLMLLIVFVMILYAAFRSM